MPEYYKNVLKVDPAIAGTSLVLPELTGAIVGTLTGTLGDAVQAQGWLSTLGVRRAFSAMGFIGAASALVLFSACTTTTGDYGALLCVACLCLFLGSHALHCSGYKASYLDVGGPTLAGLLAGIGNTWASYASYLGPKYAAAILKRAGQSPAAWSTVFNSVAALNIVGGVVYIALISDRQLLSSYGKKKVM